MKPELFELLYEQWSNRELRYQKNKKRKYQHFDRYIAFDKNLEWFKKYFKNSITNIPKHGFYPFIKSDIISPRIKHKKDGITGKKKIFKTEKVRPIAYASHFDAFIYSWYTTILNYHYTNAIKREGIEECVSAYIDKGGRCNIDFAFEAFDFIKEGHVALAFDLSSYFDGLDHDILKAKWAKVLNETKLPKDHFKVFSTLTDYTFVRKENLDVRCPPMIGNGLFKERICSPQKFRELVAPDLIEKNEFYNKICNSRKFGAKCGIPQGSPISACLSNIYLIDFDKIILEEACNKGALYRRYCDDLLLVCKEEDWQYFQELITTTIREYEVVVNQDKTEVTFFKHYKDATFRGFDITGKFKNLQYLGFEFNGENRYIRSSSMSRYYQKMTSKARQVVEDAYCEDFGQQDFLFKKKLLEIYSSHGKKNFISYGYRAGNDKKYKTIINQVKNSSEKIEKLLKGFKEEKEQSLSLEGLVNKTMR
jgi:hypothetical protein